jgi:hypothetical protein
MKKEEEEERSGRDRGRGGEGEGRNGSVHKQNGEKKIPRPKPTTVAFCLKVHRPPQTFSVHMSLRK